MTLKLKGWFDLGFQVAGKCWLLLLRSSTLIFYTSHRRSDPGSNPPNSVILCERIKDVGNLKPKSGSWKLISYDFGAEDPPRHVGNEGFRIFGEREVRKLFCPLCILLLSVPVFFVQRPLEF
ncbi:uncharacterized protein LOC108866022 isoform X3 [Pyrus x bretschneideri]|uniref:uncharacterized protein LOC108866022 isoform X3 n=1 Tax=Pyrus x bretschneideri TaxID=225117 RepID=UPI00202F3979|nr:uncharacterized protein LOC108866022 isoform X3 [Pyrus x bretschneideri]XP_048438747.1 uncharacterized protein LOC108866022 isoform X3 [Pyrus x bretschneideri]